MSEQRIEIGLDSRVRMHFALGLADGTEAVSTFDDEPMAFQMGDGSLAEGLELALYGLAAGDEQELLIDGADVYGPRDSERIQKVELTRFPVGINPEPGLIVAFTNADGEELAGSVLAVEDGLATVDFNHPLAGRELKFRCRILAVDEPGE